MGSGPKEKMSAHVSKRPEWQPIDCWKEADSEFEFSETGLSNLYTSLDGKFGALSGSLTWEAFHRASMRALTVEQREPYEVLFQAQEDDSFKDGIVDSRQFAAVAMQIAELDESPSALQTFGYNVHNRKELAVLCDGAPTDYPFCDMQRMMKSVSCKDEDNEWPDSDEDNEDGTKLIVVRPAALHTSDANTQPTS